MAFIGRSMLCACLVASLQHVIFALSAEFANNDVAKVKTLVQRLSTSLSKDRKALSVAFSTGGKDYHYTLQAFRLYSQNAKATAFTESGAHQLSTQATRSFKSRVPGKWASATLLEDGTISGLFEDEVALIDLKPLDASQVQDNASLLEAANHGDPSAHLVRYHYFSSVGNVSLLSSLQPTVRYKGVPETFDMPPNADLPHEEFGDGALKAASAKLVKWFPGCYEGDSSLHAAVINILSDVPAFKLRGKKLKSELESAVVEASLVYEKQMNFKLEIGDLKMFNSARSAPAWAKDCKKKDADLHGTLDKRYWAREWTNAGNNVPDAASTHVVTGCEIVNPAGSASLGAFCTPSKWDNKQSPGASRLWHKKWDSELRVKHRDELWRIMCHEIGHELGAEHSFEEGQGKTGGIMDYGDGKLNGVYQFNTKYRKEEMCAHLRKIGNCRGLFKKSQSGPSEPVGNDDEGSGGKGGKGGKGSIPTPSPSPAQDDDESNVSSGKGGKGGKGAPGKGGKGGKPTPSPSPAQDESSRRRRRRRRRRRTESESSRRRRRRRRRTEDD